MGRADASGPPRGRSARAAPRTCISGDGEKRWMDELAKRIEQSLKERAFCVVMEDELECCWPSEKIDPGDRENDIQNFAKSRGWVASILNTDSGVTRAIFRGPHGDKKAFA